MGRGSCATPDKVATLPLRRRIGVAWTVLRGRFPIPIEKDVEEDLRLKTETTVAGLRMDLEDARRENEALRRSLVVEKEAREDAINGAITSRLEPVLEDAVTVMSQLSLQKKLIEEGKPVQVRDVVALASALVRYFERLGLSPFGTPGEEVNFDPSLHQPLRPQTSTEKSRVKVCMSGYRLGEKILRKAMVEESKNEITEE